VRPGDLVEFDRPDLPVDHAELEGTCGILLDHIRSARWAGGSWRILWRGRVIVVDAMDLKRVGCASADDSVVG